MVALLLRALCLCVITELELSFYAVLQPLTSWPWGKNITSTAMLGQKAECTQRWNSLEPAKSNQFSVFFSEKNKNKKKGELLFLFSQSSSLTLGSFGLLTDPGTATIILLVPWMWDNCTMTVSWTTVYTYVLKQMKIMCLDFWGGGVVMSLHGGNYDYSSPLKRIFLKKFA